MIYGTADFANSRSGGVDSSSQQPTPAAPGAYSPAAHEQMLSNLAHKEGNVNVEIGGVVHAAFNQARTRCGITLSSPESWVMYTVDCQACLAIPVYRLYRYMIPSNSERIIIFDYEECFQEAMSLKEALEVAEATHAESGYRFLITSPKDEENIPHILEIHSGVALVPAK